MGFLGSLIRFRSFPFYLFANILIGLQNQVSFRIITTVASRTKLPNDRLNVVRKGYIILKGILGVLSVEMKCTQTSYVEYNLEEFFHEVEELH